MSAVLAVDGGNTKTIAVVAGADGRVLGTGRAGCADIYNAPTPDRALDAIAAAVGAALAEAGMRADELAAAAFGLAGADWP
jgi:N-acetylglucosamine kinase-like BadF-type ATPase